MLCVLVIFIISIVVFGQVTADNAVQVISTVVKDTKHNSALIKLKYEDMEKTGFDLGDSCAASLSGGLRR